MSNLVETIAKIRQAGGSLVVEDGEIKITAPAGAITKEDRAALTKHRSTLIEILAPGDLEREAIQWSDTPGADQALDLARQEWASSYDQIERVIVETFADSGIVVEAKFDHMPEQVVIETTRDGRWTEPGRGSFTIPAGTQGRLVTDLSAELADDPAELWEMEKTLKTEKERRRDPLVVWIEGRTRVMPRDQVRLKGAAA